MENKEKAKNILNIINGKLNLLTNSPEDISLINNLINSYYRKRIGVSNSKPEIMAAAFLWVYSKSNFLWEGNEKWTRQNLAELFNVNPKTLGDVSSKIMRALKIDYWDERFCRQDVMKDNPYDQFVMAPSGMIVPKEMLETLNPIAKRQSNPKEDYYDKAMDFFEQDEEGKAIEFLKKALTFDENYIDAINGLGQIYFYKDIKESKKYYQKSVESSKKELGGYWPEKLEWGFWENRPYMRAMQGLSLIFWRENNIQEAKRLFEQLLKMNPGDNQGIRYCMAAIYKGLSWDEFGKIEDKCAETGDYNSMDVLLEEQNKEHKFWKNPQEENPGE